MTPRIEELTVGEWNDFFKLFSRILQSDFGYYPLAARQNFGREELWQKIFDKGKTVFLVARVEGKIAGFILVGTEGGGVSFANWLGVHKDFRGKRIAKALVDYWQDWARSKNLHKLRATTSSEKKVPFWKKMGFNLEGIKINDRYHLNYWILGKQLPNDGAGGGGSKRKK